MDFKSKPIKLIFTKLIQDSDFGDVERFRDRISNSPRMQLEFRRTEKIWREAGEVGLFDQIDTDSDWEMVRTRLNMPNLRRHPEIPAYRYFLRIAAMIIFAGGLSVALYKTISFVNREQDHGFVNIMADHKPKEFVLPDGSLVTLNAGSKLIFNSGYNKLNREVILEGEALFEVLPDKAHPFKVFTGESVIEVTGTRFNVRQEDGSVKVAVITGTVLLSGTSDQPEKISISANQSGYFNSGNELRLEDGIEINALSWKTGHLIFDETPIDSALIDIARHFRKELLIETEISEEITAEFQNQPLGDILDEINLVAGLKFDTSGTALIVRK
jgi:ferric-dicitrate binding protein FerR (iron transport regulator)